MLAAAAGCSKSSSPSDADDAVAGHAAEARALRSGDIVIDGTRVFPESITSTSDGTVITGSMAGIIYRALPGESVARPWIQPTPENGLLAVFGVLADERSGTLWVCSVPNPFERSGEPADSALVALDLATGAPKGRYPFPAPPRGVCNDIAVAEDGTVYATDTPNGRIFTLAKGDTELRLFGQDERLNGIDGLAFAEDGTLYVNNVRANTLLRVEVREDGTMGALTELELSQPIAGPDGFRPIEGHRFLLAEGPGGRIDEVIIEGDRATIRVLREGLESSPGVTLVGDTAYAIEGKIGYLIDPQRSGQDPGEFRIHAIPLR
jgi:FOG: WD40-like repeat|nr:MAG: hypothetical protein DIU56_05465 [Pseudomonadota bacterium]